MYISCSVLTGIWISNKAAHRS